MRASAIILLACDCYLLSAAGASAIETDIITKNTNKEGYFHYVQSEMDRLWIGPRNVPDGQFGRFDRKQINIGGKMIAGCETDNRGALSDNFGSWTADSGYFICDWDAHTSIDHGECYYDKNVNDPWKIGNRTLTVRCICDDRQVFGTPNVRWGSCIFFLRFCYGCQW